MQAIGESAGGFAWSGRLEIGVCGREGRRYRAGCEGYLMRLFFAAALIAAALTSGVVAVVCLVHGDYSQACVAAAFVVGFGVSATCSLTEW